jgi:hypothetical protein
MKRFPDREELVAAYWQKLTSMIKRGGAPPRYKTQAMNGRLRSGPRLGMRQRSGALRNGKSLPATHEAARGKVTSALGPRFRSNSNS